MASGYQDILRNTGVSPLRLVDELGLRCERTPAGLRTECPFCQAPVQVYDRGFRCLNVSCSFVTGDVLDFASAHFKSTDQGVDFIRRIQPGWAEGLTHYPWTQFKPDLVREARVFRAVLDFFLLRRRRPDNGARLRAAAKLRALDWNERRMPLSLHPLCPDELKELHALVTAIDAGIPPFPPMDSVAFLYASDPHTLSEIVLQTLDEKSRVTRVRLFPARFRYFGLLELGDNPATLRINPMTAVLENSDPIGAPTYYRLACLYDGGAQDHYFPKIHALDFDAQRDSRILPLSVFHEIKPEVPVRVLEKMGVFRTLKWKDFILDYAFERMLSEKTRREYWRDFLQSAKLDGELCQCLIAQLRERGEFEFSDELATKFQTRGILTEEKITLFESPFGYHVQRKEGGFRTELSNFTIRFNANLVFRESADIFHIGEVQCGPNRFEVRIEAGRLNNLSDLEESVRGASINIGSAALPTFGDRTHLRILQRHLRDVVSRLPRLEGVSRLGWTSDKKQFQGPSWKATADGIDSTPCTLHPVTLPAAIFKNKAPEFPEALAKVSLPSDVCRVLSRLAASIVRGYLGHPLAPVYYQHDHPTRRVLTAIFSGLGQVEPMSISFGPRALGALEGVRDFPILTIGANAQQLAKSGQPVFALSERGHGLTGVAAECESLLAATASAIFRRVLSWVFEGQAEKFERARSVLFESQLDREGDAVIKAACGISGWPDSSTPYRALEAMLSRLTRDELLRDATYDLTRQVITFPVPASGRVHLTDALIELRAGCLTLAHEGSSISVDASSLLPLLENFYGAGLNIRPVNIPALT